MSGALKEAGVKPSPAATRPSAEAEEILRAIVALSESGAGWYALDDAAASEIVDLAGRLEPLNPTERPGTRADLLDGEWRMLYSTFKLEHETTLRRLSFGKLPRGTIFATGVRQFVDSATGRYDNHVDFHTETGVAGTQAVEGRFKPADDGIRLQIDFHSTWARDVAGDEAPLRTALEIDAAEVLQAPVSFSGWSDVTYLDPSYRLMRGNAGNLYVLTRV